MHGCDLGTQVRVQGMRKTPHLLMDGGESRLLLLPWCQWVQGQGQVHGWRCWCGGAGAGLVRVGSLLVVVVVAVRFHGTWYGCMHTPLHTHSSFWLSCALAHLS